MQALEDVLAQLTMFERLRVDEIARLAPRFGLESLVAGTTRTFEA